MSFQAALADRPYYTRSSMRPWPWNGYTWPGIHASDIDGDGEILSMRIRDDHGAWVGHPSDPRVLIPVDHADSPVQKGDYTAPRYRLLIEGTIENYDGFTIPTPKKPTALDLNRNFAAGTNSSRLPFLSFITDFISLFIFHRLGERDQRIWRPRAVGARDICTG